MATFLLEIGTEELPADFARLALPQLQDIAAASLAEQRLPHRSLEVTSTPRRLVVRVEGLAAEQQEARQEHKGPPAQQAFRDGQPTPAAVGFARRCGIDPTQLEVRDTPRGPFVFATTVAAGRPTAAVLAELVPNWINALQGRRFMRWGQGERRFSRPIRWLVALLDAAVVPIQLNDCDPPLSSDRYSRSHRLYGEPRNAEASSAEQSTGHGQGTEVEIPEASAYSDRLAAAGVLVERQQRAALIRRGCQRRRSSRSARQPV